MAEKIIHGILYTPVKEDGTRDEIHLVTDVNDIIYDSDKTLVQRMNEIEQLIEDAHLDDLSNTMNDLIENKAPNNHASSTNTYGVGSSELYGHVKLTDDYTEQDGALGVVLSQRAAVNMYNELLQNSGAPASHADPTTKYGVGDEQNYGHVKLSNEYKTDVDDPTGVSVSQTAVKNMYDELYNKIDEVDVGLTNEIFEDLVNMINDSPVSFTISDSQPDKNGLWANTGTPIGSGLSV